MSSADHIYGIGIGSNRRHHRHGRPEQVVAAAFERLEADFSLFDASPIIGNRAFGFAGRDFANAAALVESELEPDAMLAALKIIEHDFGRRGGRRWGDRVLDLDILAWDGGTYVARDLVIPHPALEERASALFPLARIAPDWRAGGSLKLRHLAARLASPKPLEPSATAR
ncbi:2-amino-4-hydroxy-6-hydroxymethyldihydropteridine diphosphokinase [Sphingomicrobium sp. XHP0239]|uniref:2-amino-4-hydroxy-6- hydroxymethyldihydropteridine diphosphokinase n=1 Tax=Sphingomicrobium maritimum TaxID=3133972 RepID=UPI0031CC79E2